MRDAYHDMESIVATGFQTKDLLFLALTAVVAASASLAVFAACFYWFQREQRRLQKRILKAIANSGHSPEDLFLTGSDATAYGELVAQFKVNHGKQVVSVLESEGKRFIHVDGELSPNERTKMVRYLRSEGFMS
jgi:tellurite resistance protein